MDSVLNAMNMARDALDESYKDSAPVMVLLDAAIVEVSEYNRAYELLFKDNSNLLTALEAFECIGVIDAEGGIYPQPPEAGTQVFINARAPAATPTPPAAPNDAEVKAWMHVANEWADGTCNAVQWINNIRDGISTPAEALTDMTAQIEHCHTVSAAAKRNGSRT